MIHAAIFDLDGTLIDTPKAIVTMMTKAMQDIGEKPASETDIRSTIGLPLEVGISSLLFLPKDHQKVKTCIKRYKELFYEWLVPRASDLVFPGVIEGLQELSDKGIRLGVATAKHNASAKAILRAANLLSFFDHVAGADDVSRPKPDPEMALLVMDMLHSTPESSIMIGDTHHDLNMAHGADMRTIAVTYGVDDFATLNAASPTWVADSFSEATKTLLQEAHTLAA
ncbi:MAG: HAD-IA family hydrolase [Rhodobacteraceae bacterium]|nr:HAD-IA family hydrolase [Paracoccaceae bacterium]